MESLSGLKWLLTGNEEKAISLMLSDNPSEINTATEFMRENYWDIEWRAFWEILKKYESEENSTVKEYVLSNISTVKNKASERFKSLEDEFYKTNPEIDVLSWEGKYDKDILQEYSRLKMELLRSDDKYYSKEILKPKLERALSLAKAYVKEQKLISSWAIPIDQINPTKNPWVNYGWNSNTWWNFNSQNNGIRLDTFLESKWV